MAERPRHFSYMEREFDGRSERYGSNRRISPVAEQNFRRRRCIRTRDFTDGHGRLEYRCRRCGLAEGFDGVSGSGRGCYWRTWVGKSATVEHPQVLLRLEETERSSPLHTGTLIVAGIGRGTGLHPRARNG